MTKPENSTHAPLALQSQGQTATPQTFWLGQEQPILASFHPPLSSSKSLGLVLCPPFGHEYLVSYRALRHLATHLAELGFPVLRFDYTQSGDSFDVEDSSNLLSCWEANIAAACHELKRLSGLQKVGLVGIRLGALLAARASETLRPEALILIAPTQSGRLFVREMQAFQTLYRQQFENDNSSVQQEILGYSFPTVLQEQLKNLDFQSLTQLSQPKILLISRDDRLGFEERLVKHMTQHNPSMAVLECPGYAAMMTNDAVTSEIPASAWTAVGDWLVQQFPQAPEATLSLSVQASPQTQTRSVGTVQEQILPFAGKMAILTKPVSGLNPALPVIVLSNIGANHRAGNHRLYVQLARQLAELDFAVLRLDRSGIGDSQAHPGEAENDVYNERGVQDCVDAFDALQQQYGVQRFIVAGLCSGAYFAYRVAAIDPRVVGLTMINILTFDWKPGDSLDIRRRKSMHSIQFYKRSATQKSTWLRLMQGDIHLSFIVQGLSERLAVRLWNHLKNLGRRLIGLKLPATAVVKTFNALLERKVHIHCLMDSNDGSVDLLADSLSGSSRTLQKHPLFKIDIIDEADHTFTPAWAQQWLITTICQAYQQEFNAAAPKDRRDH